MPLQLLVLALDAALYPTLLAAVVILLSQPRRKPLLSAYLAGGLTISIGLGLGIIAALKGSSAVDSSTSAVSWTTDLAVGGLALLLAVALATRADARFQERRRAKKPDKPVDPDAKQKELGHSAYWLAARLRSSSLPPSRSTCRMPRTSSDSRTSQPLTTRRPETSRLWSRSTSSCSCSLRSHSWG